MKDWTAAERQALRDAVPRLGLKTPFRGGTVNDIARRVLEIAAAGLRARHRLSASGENEGHFLDPLRATVEAGLTPAEELLELYETKWQHRLEPLFREWAY